MLNILSIRYIVLLDDKVGCLLDIVGQEKCFQCLQKEKSASGPTKPTLGEKNYWKFYIFSAILAVREVIYCNRKSKAKKVLKAKKNILKKCVLKISHKIRDNVPTKKEKDNSDKSSKLYPTLTQISTQLVML